MRPMTSQEQADLILGDFRRARTLPQHNASRLIYLTRKGLEAQGLDCGDIAYNHFDGRHRFPVVLDGRTHWITVEPDQDEMRAEMPAPTVRGDAYPSFGRVFG